MSSQMAEYGSDFWTQVLFDLASVPANYYVSLSTGLPSEENDGTQLEDIEPTDASYARLAVVTGSSGWDTNGAGLVTNLNQLVFPTPTIDWGRLEAYNLCTAATGGEVLCSGEFSEAPYVRATIPLVIPPGGLSFGLATQAQTISV
jgi:hypothetical protein